jgi:HEAT repeat protein
MKGKALWLAAAALILGLVALAVAYPLGPAVNRLRDPNPAARAAAVRAARSPSLLVEALRDENADVRLLAAMQLQGGPGRGAETARALVAALRDPHVGIRREAAAALGSVGPASWPVLREALADPDPRVRAGAAVALSWDETKDWRDRGPEEVKLFLPSLSALAKDGDSDVRLAAVGALGRYSTASPDAVAALCGAAKDPDSKVQETAVKYLEWQSRNPRR